VIVGKKISFTHIAETLGITSEDEKIQFVDKLLEKNTSLLDDFETLLASGKNMKNFLKDIMQDIQKKAIFELKE